MKRQSLKAAIRCETAKSGRCRCRCGGVLHGVARSQDPAYFAALDASDPHHALAKRVVKPRVKKRDRPLPLFDET